jgi:hypothetical protein
LLSIGDTAARFGSVAVGGPWKDKPTLYEFYVLPEERTRAFDLFESLLSATGARFMEIQSNDAILAVMLHAYAQDIVSESIVFQDGRTTMLASGVATLRCKEYTHAARGVLVLHFAANIAYPRLPILLTSDVRGAARLMQRLALTLCVPYLFHANEAGWQAEAKRAKIRPALRAGGV